MKLGLCKGCGKKVGKVNASGVLRYDPNVMAQLDMTYQVDDNPQHITHVHVIVCKDCVNAPVVENIELGLALDRNFQQFKTEYPNAICVGCKEETGA